MGLDEVPRCLDGGDVCGVGDREVWRGRGKAGVKSSDVMVRGRESRIVGVGWAVMVKWVRDEWEMAKRSSGERGRSWLAPGFE